MQIVTKFRLGCLCASLLGAACFAGCNGEGWIWDGSGNKDKTAAAKPVAQPQPKPEAARTARPDAKAAEKKPVNDPEADRINAQIAEYTDRMKSNERTGYEPNDINSKIQRQQDPNRRDRIRKVAEGSKTETAAGPETPQARPSALTGSEETGAVRKPPATPKADNVDAEPPAGEEMDRTSSPTHTENQPAVSKTGAVKPPAKPGDTVGTTKPRGTAAGGQPTDPAGVAADKAGDAAPAPRAAGTPSEKTANPKDPDKPSGTGDAEKPTKPPVLQEVKISAAPESAKEPEKKPEMETPRSVPNLPTPVPQPIDTFKERLQELETRIKKEPNNAEDQYRLRLMYLLNGDQEKALAPIDGTNAELQDLILAHVRTILSAQTNISRDPALGANQQLERVEELRNLIRARADLMVPKVVLCTAIEGYGRYTPIEPAEFKSGQKNRVLLYIEVDNFRSEKTPSGMYRTLLSVRESLLTKSGEELWSMQDANIEDLARQQRRDFYLTIGELTIPKQLSPGEYVLKVEVEDVLAGKINSSVAKFKIVP